MEPPTPPPAPPFTDKPGAACLGWQILDTHRPYENPVNRLRADRVVIPGRGELRYCYLERGESVIIVPLTDHHQLALIRQYRYPVDEHCWELPAGCCRDQGNATPEEVARRELREEIGGTAASWEHVSWFYSSSSISDEICHVFLARGVTLDQPADTEPGEHLAVHLVPLAEALDLARGGRMKTGTCALAILQCESRLTAAAAP